MRIENDMDNFLSVQGLFRKQVARDGFCLFRAVSEKVYNTQCYYKEVFFLSRIIYQQWCVNENSYYWSEYDAIRILSKIYRIDIIVYEIPGKPPVNFTKNNFEEKLILCRIDGVHLDLVYPKEYIDHAGICQSIVYEVLYRHVFNLHEQLGEAVKLIRDQNRRKHKILSVTDHSSSAESTLDTSGSSNTSGDTDSLQEVPTIEIKRNRGRRVTPPVPYRIAKALDPSIYRNTELDIWEEDKRDAIHKERYRFVTFNVGDKCQVVSEAGPIYHGHIQEISSDSDKPVTVFIEDLGKIEEVPFECLRPAKTTLRTDWWYKQWRRRKIQEMTITNIRNMLASVPPPPTQGAIPIAQQQNSIQPQNNSTPLQSKGDNPIAKKIPFPPPPVSLPNNGIFLHPPMASNHPPVVQSQGQVTTVLQGPQIAPFVSPPPQIAKQQFAVAVPEQIPAGQPQPYPRIWVPFMDDVSLSNVDVNAPPSQEAGGQDLPMNDINTLRFFYNLGVEHYRYISNLSCTIAIQNGVSGPVQPIVYCHSSKPPCPRNGISGFQLATGNNPVLNKDRNSDLDDKSSSASSDSGCETEINHGCHGNRNDCRHGNTDTGIVKTDTESVNLESKGIKPSVESISKSLTTSEVVVSAAECVVDRQSNCSDMSITETVDGSITLSNNQEQSMNRQLRPRRKYYMYGNLKLIKPIKDVPKRFLDLLNSMSAEKHRVEGEPIILASPSNGEEQYQEVITPYSFNPDAQCFVPGVSNVNMEGNATASSDFGGTSLHSAMPASSTVMYIYHQPSPANHSSSNLSNSNYSNSSQFTSVSLSNPQFPCTPLYTGYQGIQGPP